MFLGSEMERMKLDPEATIKAAMTERAGQFTDPEDADLMARDLAERLATFSLGLPQQAPAAKALPRVIDDGFSDREVIAALEAARRPAGDINRAGPDRVPPRRRDTPTEDGAPARSEGPEVQALVQWASRQGIDTTEMNAAIKDAAQRAIACGR